MLQSEQNGHTVDFDAVKMANTGDPDLTALELITHQTAPLSGSTLFACFLLSKCLV